MHLRKLKNNYDSPREMVALNDIEPLDISADSHLEDLQLCIPIIRSKWYKRGVPYMDTFYNVIINQDKQILLSNKRMDISQNAVRQPAVPIKTAVSARTVGMYIITGMNFVKNVTSKYTNKRCSV